jgi:hypothetical protein
MANDNPAFDSGGLDRSGLRAVSVFTTHDEIEADLIKDFLRSCGIECVVQGRMVPSIYPGFVGDLGKREILVLEDDAEDARELLAGWHDSGPAAEVSDEDEE